MLKNKSMIFDYQLVWTFDAEDAQKRSEEVWESQRTLNVDSGDADERGFHLVLMHNHSKALENNNGFVR